MGWRNSGGTKCPCKDCVNRKLGCHGFCRAYQDWKAEELKRKEWMYQQEEHMTPSHKQYLARFLRKRVREGRAKSRRNGIDF